MTLLVLFILFVAALIPITHYYLLSLPVTVPAVLLGRVINHRLHGDAFLKYVYLSLAVIGCVLLVQAFSGHI